MGSLGYLDQPDPKKVRDLLGKNVKFFRLQKNFSQQELSFLSKVPLMQIQRVENAKHNVQLATAERIRRALGISWDELLKGL